MSATKLPQPRPQEYNEAGEPRWQWECLRCGHSWNSQKGEKPRACAYCISVYWDRPRKNRPPKMGKKTRNRRPYIPREILEQLREAEQLKQQMEIRNDLPQAMDLPWETVVNNGPISPVTFVGEPFRPPTEVIPSEGSDSDKTEKARLRDIAEFILPPPQFKRTHD